MVKKTIIKINTKRKEIVKTIDKKVKDNAQIIKDCNARLEVEPDNRKVFGWRMEAFGHLDSGIMGLPYLVGQLEELVRDLESELNEKPEKSTPELVEFIAANKQFSATIDDLYSRKKALLDDAEMEGLWEKIMF